MVSENQSSDPFLSFTSILAIKFVRWKNVASRVYDELNYIAQLSAKPLQMLPIVERIPLVSLEEFESSPAH